MGETVFILVIMVLTGCSKSVDIGEIQEFSLGSSGRSVGSCSQENADEICREFGYFKATDYYCRTEEVGHGSFWGSWEQDIMYRVTCWRVTGE